MTIWARSWFFRQTPLRCQIQGENARQCHPLARIFDAEVGNFDEKTIAKRIVISPYACSTEKSFLFGNAFNFHALNFVSVFFQHAKSPTVKFNRIAHFG
ncbi:hypothetical protein SAMN02746062_00190 [Alysiella filiformis DSM 16848]|uniref:Uncharacterized protein n=1 Tax=Alysiella filiformis DSM 16848 TaxID=1120981 RepID=A0A286E2F7_9NEIS|nr:hypothetical protein SAMN02746062_00190 [Alysiella filiformis DSM 16848]